MRTIFQISLIGAMAIGSLVQGSDFQMMDFNEAQHKEYILNAINEDIGTEDSPGPRQHFRTLWLNEDGKPAQPPVHEIIARNEAIVFAQRISMITISNVPAGFVSIEHTPEGVEGSEFGAWRIGHVYIDQKITEQHGSHLDADKAFGASDYAMRAIFAQDPTARIWFKLGKNCHAEQAHYESMGARLVKEGVRVNVFAFSAPEIAE